MDNILKGMIIPGTVPHWRKDNLAKQLSSEDMSLFKIQNLVGEIVRLHKVLGKMKGQRLGPEYNDQINNIEQSTIASSWGVSRTIFPEILRNIQQTGSLKRQKGSGAPILVMTDAVKRKLIKILLDHKGDIVN